MRIAIDDTLLELKGCAEKADYLAKNIIEEYDLDKGMVKSQMEAMTFASNRENIGMEMEILVDYIKSIKAGADALREAVLS